MALLARLAHLLRDRGRPGHQLELTCRSPVTLTRADPEDKAPGCGWCPVGPGLGAPCRLLPASILTLGSDPLCQAQVRQPAGSLQDLFISLLKHLLKLHQCGIRPAISGLGSPPPCQGKTVRGTLLVRCPARTADECVQELPDGASSPGAYCMHRQTLSLQSYDINCLQSIFLRSYFRTTADSHAVVRNTTEIPPDPSLCSPQWWC